ncbi:MAG: LD-carboxypeptidase [Butyricicoccus sp.]
MKEIRRAGWISCSNGLQPEAAKELDHLEQVLNHEGISVRRSDCLFARDGVRSSTAKERADCLMELYDDRNIDAVFDLSGGDVANEILPYLDFSVIERAINSMGQPKSFWGYSDLTVLLNAIYSQTGLPGSLYQMRFYTGQPDLFSWSYRMVQGEELSGIVVGGNIRCLLKLAGTRYFPDCRGKVLFLEARSGGVPQMITYLSQLKQLGVLDEVSGLLLGTFTQMEREQSQPDVIQLVREIIRPDLPVAKTQDIGHAVTSKAIWIGKPVVLTEKSGIWKGEEF